MKEGEPLGAKEYIKEQFLTMMEDFVSSRYEHLTTSEGEDGVEP
jgi:hypothetical protein